MFASSACTSLLGCLFTLDAVNLFHDYCVLNVVWVLAAQPSGTGEICRRLNRPIE